MDREDFDILHEDDEDCPCGPRVEAIMGDHGEVIDWIYIHHRLDGGV